MGFRQLLNFIARLGSPQIKPVSYPVIDGFVQEKKVIFFPSWHWPRFRGLRCSTTNVMQRAPGCRREHSVPHFATAKGIDLRFASWTPAAGGVAADAKVTAFKDSCLDCAEQDHAVHGEESPDSIQKNGVKVLVFETETLEIIVCLVPFTLAKSGSLEDQANLHRRPKRSIHCRPVKKFFPIFPDNRLC